FRYAGSRSHSESIPAQNDCQSFAYSAVIINEQKALGVGRFPDLGHHSLLFSFHKLADLTHPFRTSWTVFLFLLVNEVGKALKKRPPRAGSHRRELES